MINRTCAGCHSLMDPIGFGFEKFDAIGKRREKQAIKFFPDRRAKDQTPTVGGTRSGHEREGQRAWPNSDFRTPRELGLILADSAGMPGMHREAAVPLRVRPARDRCRRAGASSDATDVSAIRSSGLKILSCS